MDRVGIRELRNNVSQVVRRARAGERLVVTVDGVPAAEIGPLSPEREMTIDELAAAGRIKAPRRKGRPPPAPEPARLPDGVTTAGILDELRADRC